MATIAIKFKISGGKQDETDYSNLPIPSAQEKPGQFDITCGEICILNIPNAATEKKICRVKPINVGSSDGFTLTEMPATQILRLTEDHE